MEFGVWKENNKKEPCQCVSEWPAQLHSRVVFGSWCTSKFLLGMFTFYSTWASPGMEIV